MNIRLIRIEGFRSFKFADWCPGTLNVLIGPNGSGKSNLLRALELMSAAAAGRLSDAILSRGGMAPLVWDGSADKITFGLVTGPIQLAGQQQPESHTYILRLRRLGNSGAFEVDLEILELETGTGPFKSLERRGTKASLYDKDSKLLHEPTDNVPPTEAALSLVSVLWEDTVVFELQKSLKAWGIYHDLRVDEGAAIRQAAVTRMEKRVAPDGQNLIPVLHTLYDGDRDFKKEINKAMSAAFPDDFEELNFPPAEDGRVQMRLRRKHGRREHTAADLSDGTIRFLLLLAILGSPDPAPLIAIDEPEVGLHPSMLPIVAEFAAEASSRSQVILTTHSPQMLDAFRGAIPTTTVFTWAGDHTEIKTMAGDELRKWVEDYSLGRFLYSGEAEAVL